MLIRFKSSPVLTTPMLFAAKLIAASISHSPPMSLFLYQLKLLIIYAFLTVSGSALGCANACITGAASGPNISPKTSCPYAFLSCGSNSAELHSCTNCSMFKLFCLIKCCAINGFIFSLDVTICNMRLRLGTLPVSPNLPPPPLGLLLTAALISTAVLPMVTSPLPCMLISLHKIAKACSAGPFICCPTPNIFKWSNMALFTLLLNVKSSTV